MTISDSDKTAAETDVKTTAETPVPDETKASESAAVDDEALAEVSGGVRPHIV